MSHDHNHDHEERELITLVDEQGNETLFEILWPLTEKKNLVKNYVLLVPVNAEEDEDGQVEIQAYSFIENEDGTEGECNQSQKTQKTNGTWLKKSSTALWRSKHVQWTCLACARN